MFMKRLRQKISILGVRLILLFFGVLLSLIVLELLLRLSGVVFLTMQGFRNTMSLKGGGEYRILALGESTTALGGEDSWPSQLEKILNTRYPAKHFSVINKG